MTVARRVVTALASAALLAGCGAPPTGPVELPTSGCPAEGWDAAVVWSSETAPASHVDYVSGERVVASAPLASQGLPAAPAEAPFRSGTDAWLPANGNTTRDKTHVLHWSETDCSTRAYRVDEQVIWSVVATDEAFYTTNTVNAEAHVRRRTMDGTLTHEVGIPFTVFSSLALDGDRLHAVGTMGDPGTEETVLVTFDAETLTEERRLVLGPSSLPVSTLVHDGELYLPAAATSNPDGSGQEVSTVLVVDLVSGTPRTIDLGVVSPYLVTGWGGGLVFAHTFMNPAFRDMDAYGDVTLLEPGSGETTTVDLGPALRQVVATGDDLLVLTQPGDGAARLTRYALPGMGELSSVEVPAPPGGRHYLSGILARSGAA